MALAVFMAWASSARAEDARALSLPVAQGSTDVAYPEHAHGDAEVVLEVVVEKDGTVSHPVVIEGAAPFAEQARRGALAWRFAPARRGDTSVAVRIRAHVAFHQEEPRLAPSAADAPSTRAGAGPSKPASPAQGPAAALGPPLEVTVLGDRREIGQTRISAADVREMPGAFGDPFRAIEALPGVTPILSGLPYFFIRGAPPNNNGYFLDGVRVPLLFHVALGPGVIHPGLVDRVDFFPGAAPASYGGFAGAVIAGQTREPATTPHGEANVRVIDAGALVESPFADGRGTALASGRYGYPGPIVSAISSATLGYWDYQSRATWRFGERDTVGVFAFGSHDYLGHNDSQSGNTVEDFVSDFHRVDLRYDHALLDGRVRLALTMGYDSQGAAPSYLTNTSAALRLEVDKKLSPTVRVRGGADARLDAYGFKLSATPKPGDQVVPSSADPPPTNVTSGAHADVVWRIAPRVELVPGVRVDVFESSRPIADGAATRTSATIPAVDPRLSARLTVAPSVAWLSTFGLAHQYPALRVGSLPALVVSGSGFPPGDAHLQTVGQASQGLEVALPAEIVLTATGFLSGWSGLTDLTATCIQIMPAVVPPSGGGAGHPAPGQQQQPPATPYTCPDNRPVNGRAYGLELLVRRPLTKRLSGWLSYTLSRSTREAHFVTPQGGDAVATVASEFDRTHVLNAIVAYDFGRRWRAGARFVFYTSAPYSTLAGNVPVPPYNDQRGPPFFRLDLRLEKRWPIGKSGSIAFVVEGQNVTLSKEVSGLGVSCMSDAANAGGTTRCTQKTMGPITIPSVGAEALF